MSRRFWIAPFAALVAVVVAPRVGDTAEWNPVSLSERVGDTVDAQERERYSLFPDVPGFVSARFETRAGEQYRIVMTTRTETGALRTRTRTLPAGIWGLAIAHARLVEEYESLRERAGEATDEATTQYRMALRYAARARYDIAWTLMADIESDFPGSRVANAAQAHRPDLDRLATARRSVFLPGSLVDRGGRTDLLVFSGYYGLWTGIAAPVVLEADDPAPYAVGLLIGAPAGVFLAHTMTKDREVSRGTASIISLGGHWGTWQGMGWAGVSDLDGNEVVGVGLLGGLAGIGGAAILTRHVSFSEGHGALTSMALPWGIWFGIAGAAVADAEGNNVLRAALITSDVFVLGSGIAARDAQMSRARVRLISLSGVAGTAAGFGIALLAGGDNLSSETAFAAGGAGSVAGLVAGAVLTRQYDRNRDIVANPGGTLFALRMTPNPFDRSELMPWLVFRVNAW